LREKKLVWVWLLILGVNLFYVMGVF
jgi:hypothetical protein